MLGIEDERYRPLLSRDLHSLEGDQVSVQRGIMVACAQREGGRAELGCQAWEGQGRLPGGGNEGAIQFCPFRRATEKGEDELKSQA